jgi:hypothetical protein
MLAGVATARKDPSPSLAGTVNASRLRASASSIVKFGSAGTPSPMELLRTKVSSLVPSNSM